jgi:hypothetical protein
MSKDTYLKSNIIRAIKDKYYSFISSTVNIVCINKEVA